MNRINRISIDNYYSLLRGHLRGDQKKVLEFFEKNKQTSFTTRRAAALIGLDLLTVRPRVTELVQKKLLQEAGKVKKEGLYQYREPQPEEQLCLEILEIKDKN